MSPSSFRLAFVVLLLAAASGQAQTLAANSLSNNGSGGIFLNLTPVSTSLLLTQIDTQFTSAAGSAVSVEVWTRPGSYTGFTASNAGWTLTQTVAATSAGTATNAPVVFTAPVNLPAGNSTSVYLHAVTAGGGIRYFGTGTTSTTSFANADLSLFSDTARTGAVAFGGTAFTPRALVGTVYYAPVPEPATLGLVAAAGLAVVRGRKVLRSQRT